MSALCGGLWIADLVSRPPCPPGYVRFIDLDPASVFLSAALLAFSSVLLLMAVRRRRSRRRIRWIVVAAAVAVLLSLGGSLVAVEMIRVDASSSVGTCWTF
jgi:hypothetical protein